MSPSLSRRSVMTGVAAIGAGSAALVAPIAIAAARPVAEHPNDKVRRLAREIMDALNDPAFLGFRQVTITPTVTMYQNTEQDMPADERALLHFNRLAGAMNELTANSHGWTLHAHEYNSGGAVKYCDRRGGIANTVNLQRELDPRLKGGLIYIDKARELSWFQEAIRMDSMRSVPAIPTVRRRA